VTNQAHNRACRRVVAEGMTVDIVTHRSANTDLVRCDIDVAKRAVREEIGLAVSLLRPHYEIEKKRYRDSMASQRLLGS
jgi:hypothetical protein